MLEILIWCLIFNTFYGVFAEPEKFVKCLTGNCEQFRLEGTTQIFVEPPFLNGPRQCFYVNQEWLDASLYITLADDVQSSGLLVLRRQKGGQDEFFELFMQENSFLSHDTEGYVLVCNVSLSQNVYAPMFKRVTKATKIDVIFVNHFQKLQVFINDRRVTPMEKLVGKEMAERLGGVRVYHTPPRAIALHTTYKIPERCLTFAEQLKFILWEWASRIVKK